jgi:hypothetical protein
MIQITRLPEEVKRFLMPLRPLFSYRHFLVFCWLMVAHAICFEKATFEALGRYTPTHIAWWHLRQLMALLVLAVGRGAPVVGDPSLGGLSTPSDPRFLSCHGLSGRGGPRRLSPQFAQAHGVA